jgi:hypothetical protein
MIDIGGAEAFLDALLAGTGDDGDHLYFYGWTLADKRSHWFPVSDGVEPAAERLVSLAENSDVYIGVSLADEALGGNQRVRSDSSAGIFGLWADIDVRDPDVHKKWNLPPDIDSAVELLDSTGCEPTIVVHSGHGLQAWWLFSEAMIFHTEEDRAEAAQLAESWNTTLRVLAAERNWTVDSTFDLARVMRLPGTVNRKGEPVPVCFYRDSFGPFYNPSDLSDFFVSEERLKQSGLKATRSYVVGDLVLDAQASAPADRLMALRDADDRFDATWKEDRRDLDRVDGSPSQYDMSMIAQLVAAHWEDQDIVDACIHRRRSRGHDLKLRADYWKRTIAKARSNAAVEWSEEHLEEQVDALAEAKADGDDEMVRERRREVLDSLSTMLGYEITSFIKFVGDPPSFDLRTPIGSVHYADAAQFTSQNQFCSKFWSVTGYRPTNMRPADWNNIVNLFGDIWEEQEIGSEATELGLMSRYLENYLDTCPPETSADQALSYGYPFEDEAGDVFIFSGNLRNFLWTSHGERMKPRDIGRLLSNLGHIPEKINILVGGKRTSRSVWKLSQR